ncbi:MAG: thioredoxin [Gemmatimonadaceae bacterium]|nr:thioredoxin [Gemmatimonadaceae bacterium]
MTTPETSRTVVVPCASCGTLNRVDLARAGSSPVCGPCRTPLVLDQPIELTDATFDKVINGSSVPVMVDFYADWCGPCKMMAPVFAQFALQQKGRALIAKVDTDNNPQVSSRFGIRSIPTLTVHAGGREVARQVGAVPMAALQQLLSRASGAA